MIAIAEDTKSMLDRLLQLPAEQRVAVAMALWNSIEDAEKPIRPDVENETEFYEELMRRDAEMEAGINVMTEEEFMAAVRKDLACARASTPDREQK